MKKKLITLLLASAMISTLITPTTANTLTTEPTKPPTVAFAAQTSINRIQNTYLNLYFNENNKDFYFKTNQGDLSNPNDNDVKLLYGNTNRENLRIGSDGEMLDLRSAFGESLIVNNNTAVATATIGNITITRTIKLVKAGSSSYENAAEFEYKITNNGQSVEDVSLRLFLDIMLADNDHAPFNIPGKDSFTKQKSFTGSNIPEYWFAYDNLSNPTVVTRGTNLSNYKPSRVDFVNWYSNKDPYSWENPVDETKNIGDSAVVLYWDNNLIQPGETKTIKTHYGLETLDTNVSGELAASILGGDTKEIVANENGVYENYLSNLIMQNTGEGSLTNVTATIEIPAKFQNSIKLADDTSNTIILDTLSSNQTINHVWPLEFTNSYKDQALYYNIKITANNNGEIVEQILKQNLNVKANIQYAFSAKIEGGETVVINPNAENKYDIYKSITNVSNTGTEALQDVEVSISIPEEFIDIISINDTELTKKINNIDSDETIAVNWDIQLSDSYDSRAPYYIVTVKNGDNVIELTQKLEVNGLTKPELPVEPEKPANPKPEEKPVNKLPQTGAPFAAATPIAGGLLTLLGLAMLRKKKED